MDMTLMRVVVLVSAVCGAASAQSVNLRAPDFATTKSSKGQPLFDSRLARIRNLLMGGEAKVPFSLVSGLERSARDALGDEDATRRMLAVRTLGTLTHFPGALPHLQVHLIKATQDSSRLVRREAVLQLRDARYPATFMIGDVCKALLAVIAEYGEDVDLAELATASERQLSKMLQASRDARKGKGASKAETQGQTMAKRRISNKRKAPARRRQANESAAIATLKNLSSAQAQMQASGRIDTDGDAAGEYGFLAELSGGIEVRKDERGGVGKERMRPPVLSGAFKNVVGGVVIRSGYCFCVFLPGTDGTPVGEAKTGGGKGCPIKADWAEVVWCAYAWPLSYGKGGSMVFFVDQSGDVLAANNATTRYSSPDRRPNPQAAYRATEAKNARMGDRSAANHLGRDGNFWTVVN
jgi:hypothetical protein